MGYQVAYKNHAEKIGSISAWGLVGRISLDDGDEGGSGRLQWVVKADQSTINFHGAMGRGAWQLKTGPQGAVLTLADGNEYFASAVDALIQEQIGWPVPVDALQWWVRGLAAPGPVDEQQLDSGGLLTNLEQFGWQIEFNRYASDASVPMPTRLDVRQKNYRIKLAVSRWQMPLTDVTEN